MDKDILATSAASRRTFLKTAAAAGAGIALGAQAFPLGAQAFPLAAHAATDDPSTIINVALTAEYLAVTAITNVLNSATTIGLTPAEVTTFQGIAAVEALHVDYLTAYGAVAPYAGPFAFPAGTFTSRTTLANTLVILETAFVAAYMAATREFAADARADLANLTYQIGAVEAEHRALARVVGGYTPFNDVAFEANLIPNVAAAATVLTNLGFLSPTSGNSYTYTTANQQQAMSYTSLLAQTTP